MSQTLHFPFLHADLRGVWPVWWGHTVETQHDTQTHTYILSEHRELGWRHVQLGEESYQHLAPSRGGEDGALSPPTPPKPTPTVAAIPLLAGPLNLPHSLSPESTEPMNTQS